MHLSIPIPHERTFCQVIELSGLVAPRVDELCAGRAVCQMTEEPADLGTNGVRIAWSVGRSTKGEKDEHLAGVVAVIREKAIEIDVNWGSTLLAHMADGVVEKVICNRIASEVEMALKKVGQTVSVAA